VCENVVIPNITLRDSDSELFEDNPQEYITRDIEGSDANTRRRSACELVKGLRKHYEEVCCFVGLFCVFWLGL
jgi:exportin-2 (importin alpha re-exporter)